jgi:beta-lactamase class A
MQRRSFNALAAAALVPLFGKAAAAAQPSLQEMAIALEARLRGRLGVMCLDTGSGRTAGHRTDERFAMCSTFKWLAAAAVLRRVDAGEESLERRIRFGREALLEWAPVTQHRTGGEGMTVAELCEAAVALSDNTAANLLLQTLGGPAGWTRYVRSIGDARSRLDRNEPALNESRPGDERDTTTPAAMAVDLQRALLGDALSESSREQLKQWMLATKTGDHRLRAGLPAGWRVGDKTGTGERGTAGDVGVLWPPSGAPIVVAAYVTQAGVPREQQEAAFAEVGRWVAGWARR